MSLLNGLKYIILSPITLVAIGSLAALAYMLSSEAFERSMYALNYGAAQVEYGYWTESQSPIMIGRTLLDGAGSLCVPLLCIMGITIILLALQHRVRKPA